MCFGHHCGSSVLIFSSTLTQRTAQLTHASGDGGFSGGLEASEAESATSELASYKERAEKLEEDLLVRRATWLPIHSFLPHFLSVRSLDLDLQLQC